MNTALSKELNQTNSFRIFVHNHRTKINNTLVSILLIMLISGCAATSIIYFQGNHQINKPAVWSAVNFDATPTPTPFQPLDPTPTYIPTAMPTEAPRQNREKEESSRGNNKPADKIENPAEVINLLVLGSDQRPYDGGFRTDTIILVSINTSDKSVSMVSFPRDLYVYIPGWSYQRINTAMGYGGFDLLAQTLDYNFGVKPTSYIMVNFDVFQNIINKLGGLEVEVASTFKDIYLDGNYKRVPAGTNHMNGATALWYARSRQTSNDFDRARRQQEVLHAVIKRILKADVLENAKVLFDAYVNNVTTNISWKETASLISLSVNLKDPSQIKRYVIGPGDVYDWITPGGAMVLVPYQERIINLLHEAIGN
jgi:LCP family protein required for cell wall assembly